MKFLLLFADTYNHTLIGERWNTYYVDVYMYFSIVHTIFIEQQLLCYSTKLKYLKTCYLYEFTLYSSVND